MDFFGEVARVYECWAEEAVVDGGPWYQGALFRLRKTKRVRMRGGVRNYVEHWFRELKRRAEVFDLSFPQKKADQRSMNNWLRVFAWHYNQSLVLKETLSLT